MRSISLLLNGSSNQVQFAETCKGVQLRVIKEPGGSWYTVMMASTYYTRSFGCQMNDHDTSRVEGLLQSSGMHEVDDPGDADVVFVNTCCIRENADNKLYGFLGQMKSLRQSNPAMRIVVGGCLAQREKEQLVERAPYVDVVVGTYNLSRIPALLEYGIGVGRSVVEVPETREEAEEIAGYQGGSYAWSMPPMNSTPWSAYVSIQSGCNNSCTFCTVPMVRGPESSRPIDDIISEVSKLASKGVSEIILLGQNVNSYGRDITRRRPLFAQLLREVGAVDGVRRVRFTSPHPKDLLPETIDAMATVEAVCEQLHFPLQSGSDRILAMMHRGYNAERYLTKLRAAREVIPDLAVTTDIIVGFPGETEDDFEETLKVVAEAQFDAAYTFEFSSRPGTVAAGMVDQFVESGVVSSRFSRLVELVERSALERNRARVGMIEEVQVEGTSKKDPSVLTGRTRQGKLVHFCSEHLLHPGSYIQVKITDAGPHHLKGEYRGKIPLRLNHLRIPVRAACI